MPRNFILILAIITIFSATIRLFRINEPNRYYFDEVYHVVTARAFAQNNPAAYDPFAPPPEEGTAYDWLHPPLAKLIQAASIKIFGDNPIAWRLPSAIFGTALILATAILATVMFGKKAGVFAGLILAFENLTLVMSRITMNDIFIAFFSVCAFIFAALYSKKQKLIWLFASSIFLGLAVASKWTGAYALLIVFAFLFLERLKNQKSLLPLLTLVIIPFFIYLASYGQFWIQGHNAKQFIDLHKQIWWYQNRSDLEHPYGTTALFCVPKGLDGPRTWCPWILDIRGVYFSLETYGPKNGYIYALGNPLIFWAGVISISYLIGKLITERKKELILILLGYFIFWLPWIFTPRLLFLYHYLPSIPFLAIALGILLKDIWETKFKFLTILAILIFAVAFFFFYPITSGYPINPQVLEKIMWLETWR